MQEGADANAKDQFGQTLLDWLYKYYRNDILIELVFLMIENGANVNAKNGDGRIPLHILCEYYKKDDMIDLVTYFI